jgi:hypothetical protein
LDWSAWCWRSVCIFKRRVQVTTSPNIIMLHNLLLQHVNGFK